MATAAIFLAVIFGQFEAGLAQPYEAAQPTLNWHTVTGWSLSAILAAITAWRFVIRDRNRQKLPTPYLGVATFLIILVGFQVYLGTRLIWVYGLHVEPVVEDTKQGVSYCLGQWSYSWMPLEASTDAQRIDDLFSFLVTLGSIIFFGVIGMIVFSLIIY